MIIAKTERLLLRTVTVDDAEDSFAIYGDPEVMKYIDDEEPFASVEQARESIERGIIHQEKHGCCHWATVLKDTGQMIGHCGFAIFEDTNDLEMAVHFNRSFWQQGYATEAGRACINYAQGKWPGRRVVGLALDGNVASVKLMQKLGMVTEGRITLDGLEFDRHSLVL